MTEEEVNKSIARVILSTKRKSRQFSLFEIANDIENLKNEKGSLNEVAKLIGLSPGMLSQFLSIFKLPKSVIELIKERKIDSVTIVHHLTKFKDNDILELSKLAAKNEISSQDLRILIPYRKQHANEDILDLVEKIHLSKNIKVSVVRILESDTTKSLSELEELFIKVVGKENILVIELNGNFIDIKLTKQGENNLRSKAKQLSLTLRELITRLTT